MRTGRQERSKHVLFRSVAREKILRGATALENAVSVASLLLLTEATPTEVPERKEESAPEPEKAAGQPSSPWRRAAPARRRGLGE